MAAAPQKASEARPPAMVHAPTPRQTPEAAFLHFRDEFLDRL